MADLHQLFKDSATLVLEQVGAFVLFSRGIELMRPCVHERKL